MVSDNQVILLGEDIQDDALLFQLALIRGGLNCKLCVLEQAVEIIDYLSGKGQFRERGRFPLPGIVFLDGQLHHQPSMGLLRWMVAQPYMKGIPIIILTGSLDPKICREAKEIGAFACFEKPFTERDIQHLQYLLEHGTPTVTRGNGTQAGADAIAKPHRLA